MKKNIIGHMTVAKESAVGRLRKLRILPKLFCLLLALLIWLAVVDVNEMRKSEGASDVGASEVTE